MNCQEALEAISAAIDGELSPDERAALDAHLASCPACAALFEELSGQSRLLRDLDCAVPADLSARILASLPDRAEDGGAGSKPNVTPFPVKKRPALWRRLGTLAACLALVIWAGASLLPGTFAGRSGEAAPGDAATFSAGSTDIDSAGTPQYAPVPSPNGAIGGGSDQDALNPGMQFSFKNNSVPVYTCSLLLDVGAAPEEPEAVVLTGADDLTGLLESCSEALFDRADELDEALLFDSGAAIAVALPEAEHCAGYTVNGVFPTETGGCDISLTPIPSQLEEDDAAGYLVLIAADAALSPEAAITVFIEE